MTNIKKKWTILIVATFVTFFGIGYTLLKGTQASSEIPANSAFDDMNFYKCVIDSYNAQKSTSLDYTYNLDDSELAEIEILYCYDVALNSVKGLEKLTGLIRIYMRDSTGNYAMKISDMDLSYNTNLEALNLTFTEISNLNVSNNKKLKDIYLFANQITSLDLSNNTNLVSFVIYSGGVTGAGRETAALTDLKLSDSVNLKTLKVNGDLTNLDVTKNTGLTVLNVSANKLTNLDLSKNTELTELDVSYNKLTNLDLSKNTELTKLNIYNNELTSLDLSKNTKLEELSIYNNPYGEELYLYANSKDVVSNKVVIPSHLGWDNPTWTSGDTSIATIDSDGNITTLKAGSVNIEGVVTDKYTTTSTVNVVKITSDKYIINENKSYINVGSDTDVNTIKSNINKSNDNINIDVDMNNYKLYVKYGDEVLKEFKVVGYSSDIYDLSKDYIYVGNVSIDTEQINTTNDVFVIESEDKLLIKYLEEILDEYNIVGFSLNDYEIVGNKIMVPKNNNLYSNLMESFSGDTGMDFQVFNGEELITSGNVLNDMIVKILYNEEVVEEYVVSDEILYMDFNDSIILSEDDYIISNVASGSMLSDIILETNGTVSLLDNEGNVLDSDSKLKTGDKIKILYSDDELIYTVSVSGDIDGNGYVNEVDLELISEHLINNVITGNIYLESADIDNNGKLNINDVIKIARLAL